MFGIDFSELVVCLVVALFVIGPQRLPEAVRTFSLGIGRLKRSLRETRETIEQQLGVEEIRRQLHTEEMMRTLDSMQEEIETALNYERMGNKPVLEHGKLADAAPAAEDLPLSLEAQAFVDTRLTLNELPVIDPLEDAALANNQDTGHGGTIKAGLV